MNNMKIIISGYGRMGREIESVLLERGHTCIECSEDITSVDPQKAADAVCIDFTNAQAFSANYKFIADNFKAAVVGTTGWNDIRGEVISYFESKGKPMMFASNFSIGVNIMFKLSEMCSKMVAGMADYDPYLIEMHHKFKLDAPSGTAKTLASIVSKNTGKSIEVQSVRSGFIPGIHELGFESQVDRIKITHEAFSRRGFAEGSVVAAEWTSDIKGVCEFREILEEKFNKIIGIC
jgi:4-hydroxy-tetrahydrodipicolinate reductase